MTERMTRRNFIRNASLAAAGTGAALAHGAHSANERIRVGVIGPANRGGQLMDALKPHEDAEIVALCDVDGRSLARWREDYRQASVFSDYRRLLDREDIDAVVIATPDHWHALQTIHACEAGKDVYVEKPSSMTIHEGQRMIAAARRTNRIVQVGLQRRASKMYAELAAIVQRGGIGKVTTAHCYRVSNMAPGGIGRAQPSEPPEELDWDLWLGPRAMRPYQDNITPYNFRWWKDYSSQIANWGVHYFDLIRWMLDERAPKAVTAMGGQYAVDDDRTIPDTMHAVFELPSGCLMTFGQYEASGNTPFPKPAEVELRGTEGTLYARGSQYQIVPERGGQFQDRQPRMEAVEKSVEDGDVTIAIMRDFLDCIKTRHTPLCDLETGHRSTTFALLANIAMATKSHIEWDAENERITNNEEANHLLHYEYRAPWKLI